MFITRVLSSVVLVILAFAAIWAGDIILLLTMFAVSLIGFRELTKAMGISSGQAQAGAPVSLLEVIGGLGSAAYYTALYLQGFGSFAAMAVTATFLCLLTVYVFSFPKYRCEKPIGVFFSYMYAPILLSFLYLTRMLENGFYLVWMIFIGSWISDTCAYLAGRAFGRHKLAPKLSPKKSIEGSVGGILGSALVGALYGFVLLKTGVTEIACQVPVFALLGAAGSVISQIGDLAASGIKRDHDIKDYGKLIPGHGGIMDRFDSVIVTAPVIYFLSILFAA